MEQKGYPDQTITERRMMLFLSEIQHRKAYKRGKKRKISQMEGLEEEDAETRNVGWHTLDGYVCAIMDLWKMQFQVFCVIMV